MPVSVCLSVRRPYFVNRCAYVLELLCNRAIPSSAVSRFVARISVLVTLNLFHNGVNTSKIV